MSEPITDRRKNDCADPSCVAARLVDQLLAENRDLSSVSLLEMKRRLHAALVLADDCDESS